LGPQARAKKLWCISTLRLSGRKNRTGIGSHPVRTAGRRNPVISGTQKGYVRRSEVTSRTVPEGVESSESAHIACTMIWRQRLCGIKRPVYQRRALLLGLAALAGGATLGGVLAYPRVEWARWWYDVIGVDVSNHQGDIDWPVLARTDIGFAYIKATEGGDFRDRRFQTNWDGARKARLPRGAYHFFTQCRSGADQARNFIGLVPREPDALPPVLDLEDMGTCHSGPQVVNLVEEIVTALNMLETHYGRRPLLYVTPEFDAAYLQGRFTNETFWARSLVLPPQFRTDQWLIWQYHSSGRRAGVNGPLDLNAFRGSKRQFDAFITGMRNA
jgi:lysozyme